jgi:hypothetical protein
MTGNNPFFNFEVVTIIIVVFKDFVLTLLLFNFTLNSKIL